MSESGTIRLARNRQFLTDLFLGPFRGHGILFDAPDLQYPDWSVGDVATSERPVADFVPLAVANYAARLRCHEALDDDSVPYVIPWTGTAVFPAAFGCKIHFYEDSAPYPHALVETSGEADALDTPTLEARVFQRLFAFGDLIRQELGSEVSLGVPDIQSPFDIAAMIWHKEDLFVAMYEEPEAVKRLVDKCQQILTEFLSAYKQRFVNVNFCHCPTAWAPPAAGVWMSEDEIGSLTPAMVEEFSLPSLIAMSERFGGINLHCCATADHQYPTLRTLPNFHGLNRVFQDPGPRPAVKAFAGYTVLVNGWQWEESVMDFLNMAEPDSRFLFSMNGMALDDAKRVLERLWTPLGRA